MGGKTAFGIGIVTCVLILKSTTCVVLLENPVVEVEDGKIRGHLMKPNNGNPYFAFQEIPYAAPPIADLRFAEPIAPQKWDGIRDATKNTKICNFKKVSYEAGDPRENEDCLFLNVFTPKDISDVRFLWGPSHQGINGNEAADKYAKEATVGNSAHEVNSTVISDVKAFIETKIVSQWQSEWQIKESGKQWPKLYGNQDEEKTYIKSLVDSSNGSLLPVYVYIYGGNYISGDPTEYNFQGFLDEDIVVVTMSYRSPLGFLTTGDNVIPGNIGIKDQLSAIKWVNRNIAKFGGDPTKVTLGGHSSGAMLVGYHLLNTKAKGKTISPQFSSKNTSEDLLNLLTSVPVEKITETDIEYPDGFTYENYRPVYAPVVEDPDYENAVVIGPMHDNFAKGISNHVPMLIGITGEEHIKYHNASSVASLVDADLTLMIDPTLRIKKENFLPMAKELKDIYSSKKYFRENVTGLVKAMSDLSFVMPVSNNAILHSKYSAVYFYQFSYKSPYNGKDVWKQFEWYQPGVTGLAGHTDELPLLYYYRLDPNVSPTVEDLKMRKKMIKLWSNFIKYTNPTPSKDPLFNHIKWPQVKPESFDFVDINSNLTIQKNPSRFLDWQNRIEKYFDSPRYSY